MPRNVIRTYVQERRTGPLFSRGSGNLGSVVTEAMEATATDIVREFMKRAAADISGAGKFGSRWTNGFTANVSRGGGNVRVDISHQVPYFNVFTKTTTIQGKPMLWIPLGHDAAKDAQGIRARDYPGRLFRVNRKDGKSPLLLTWAKPAVPKYHGQTSVTIPKKFHTFEIARDVMKEAGPLFKRRMGNG